MPASAKVKNRTRVRSFRSPRTILPRTEQRPADGRSARLLASLAFGAADLAVLVGCFSGASLFFPLLTSKGFFLFFSTFFPCIPIYIVAFAISGLYPGFCLAPAEELRRYTRATFFVTAIGLAINTKFYFVYDGDEAVYLVAWLTSVPVLWACRVAARALASRSKWWGVPAVVFGSGNEAHSLIDRLQRCRWIGYRPELLVTDEPRNGASYRGVPIIYGFEAGIKAAAPRGFSTALVAFPGNDPLKRREVILRYARTFQTFITFSELIGITGVWAKVRDFEGVIGLSTKQKLLVPFNSTAKRVLDIFGVAVIGLMAIPFCLIMAILIKLDSPGPVFFKHPRLGKKGKEITVLKFRTMTPDAERRLMRCLEEDPSLYNEWNHNHKLKRDPRVTRVGRFLRVTSLDELPQLWNVLKGEMSFIGPRPIVKQELRFYGSAWHEMSSVLPGISGLWQVSGRSDTDYGKRVELDTYYIQNWSIWLDAFILVKTLWIVLTQKGAC